MDSGNSRRRRFCVQGTARNVDGDGLWPIPRLVGRREGGREDCRDHRLEAINGPASWVIATGGSGGEGRCTRYRRRVGANVNQAAGIRGVILAFRITSAGDCNDSRTVVRRGHGL